MRIRIIIRSTVVGSSWRLWISTRLQREDSEAAWGIDSSTTNRMGPHPDANPADMAEDLTLFSWDSYPVTGWDKDPKDETFRMADPSGIGLSHDHMASFHGRWGLMELQPGQVNWSGVPVLVYPGAIRLDLGRRRGARAETTVCPAAAFNCYFTVGLIGIDGITPSAGD